MADQPGSPGEPFASPLDPGARAVLARLPVGRHGLPREFVAANQRSRLISAALEVFTARGYPAASIADIVKAAGVSRNAFYANFVDKEACLLATSEAVVGRLTEDLHRACAGADDWAHGVLVAVGSLTAILAEDPRLARLLLVDLLRAGAPARRRHEALLERLAAELRPGRDLGGPGAAMPAIFEVALVAGAFWVVGRRVSTGAVDTVAGLAPELTELLLAPFLGPAAAHRIAMPAD